MDERASLAGFRIGRGYALGDHFFASRELAAEGRHLDDLRAELDVREAEPASDDPAVPEELLDLRRMRGGSDVEVFGFPAEQQVANAAAHQICDVVSLPKAIEHFERVRIDVAARDRMRVARHDLGHSAHGFQLLLTLWLPSSSRRCRRPRSAAPQALPPTACGAARARPAHRRRPRALQTAARRARSESYGPSGGS